MKYHVHVYSLSGLCEIDLDAESEQDAMREALSKATELDSPAWQEPDNKYLALPFAIDDKCICGACVVDEACTDPQQHQQWEEGVERRLGEQISKIEIPGMPVEGKS